ncbi:EamA family transporter [Chromobacterium sphagni]|uniref:EamA family transporter n=1 Tax=Chromobacterium sphagni TaxID=1903179 RepID=UPI00195673BE|nr:EamA family transporter [Chromobacterium sphagni]
MTAALLAAALLSAPFGLASHALPSPRQLAAVAELALLMPLLPYVLEISALRLMPAASFGILSSAEPAVAALAGYLLLAQAIAPAQMLGVLLVVAASLGALTLA